MFKDDDFLKMEFQIYKVRDVDQVDRLRNIYGLELLTGNNRDKIIRYLLYMYDYGSPFQTIRDVPQRKRAVAMHCDFDFHKEEKLLKDLFSLEGIYSVIVVGILREQNNALYASIVIKEQLFYQYAERLIRPITPGVSDKDEIDALVKQQKLGQALDESLVSIQKAYKEMSGGDSILEKVLPVAVQITKTEGIARMIKYRQ